MVLSTGKTFENKIRNWHKGIDCLTFKFPDYGSTGSIQLAWCDRVTVTARGTFWFECKHTESKTSFNLGLIKGHQLKTMLELENFGCFAVFLIEDGNHNVYWVLPSFIKKQKGKSIKFTSISRFLTDKMGFRRNIYI